LQSNITLRGTGGATIKVANSPNATTPPITTLSYTTQNGINLPSAYDSNITLKELKFDGMKSTSDITASANYSGNLVMMYGVNKLNIQECTVCNVKNDAITAAICNDVLVNLNTISDVCKVGIYFSGCNRVTALGNNIKKVNGINPANSANDWGWGIEVSQTWWANISGNNVSLSSSGLITDRDSRYVACNGNVFNATVGQKCSMSITGGSALGNGSENRTAAERSVQKFWGVYDSTFNNNVCTGFVWIKACRNVKFDSNQIEYISAWTGVALWINEGEANTFTNNQIYMPLNGTAIKITRTGETNYGGLSSRSGDTWNNIITNNTVITNTSVNALILLNADQTTNVNNNFAKHNTIIGWSAWGSIVVGFNNTGTGNNAYQNAHRTSSGGFGIADGSF
jgi:hypothetical protein